MKHSTLLLFVILSICGCSKKSSDAASVTPTPAIENQKMEYGIPVPGKPGFVQSPYAPKNGYVDVRGFPKDTEVKDPYTGRIFLVPEDMVPVQPAPQSTPIQN